ncbi:hypothetical protein B0T26DRAFT_768858 [Lasiosphaeria miniovina]|uniref:Uncharacterized protein n=1 Tax=Lasiosphaeria miniovina TaxID=1954250 RepID=A0AA40B712_9PEZI|nr:uncharacterized protein B0T26DRAFT_768858 [Lasiosphaeria miniovina]KAK0728846.1 hypothetical protein B0T26DRAFT_768858 [Lasiosphaeria miniovina]
MLSNLGNKEQGQGPNYKPAVLKWPFLLVLFLSICSLAGLLECARRVLPSAEEHADVDRLLGTPLLSPIPGPRPSRSAAPARNASPSPQPARARRQAAGPVPSLRWPRGNTTAFNQTAANTTATTANTTANNTLHNSPGPVQVLDNSLATANSWNGWPSGPGPRALFLQPNYYADESLPISYYYPIVPESVSWDAVKYYECGGPKTAPDMCECDFILFGLVPADTPQDQRPPGTCAARQEMTSSSFPCAPDPAESKRMYTAMANAYYDCVGDFGDAALAQIQGQGKTSHRGYGPGQAAFSVSLWMPALVTRMDSPPPATTAIVRVTRSFEAVSQLPDGREVTYTNTATVFIAEPAVWQTAVVTTLTGSHGHPTATSTSFPRGMLVGTQDVVVTLRDANGSPTATVATPAPLSTHVVTLTDSAGVSTATVTEYASFPDVGADTAVARVPARGDYFVGSFVPVLLATLLSIMIETVDSQLKSLLPFHALTRPGGALARHSLSLSTAGPASRVNSLRQLYRFREPLSFLGDLLVLAASVLTALSSEVVTVEWFGPCNNNSYDGCFIMLSVYQTRVGVALALLVFMATVAAVLAVVLLRWRTGVAAPPWSMASLAALVAGCRHTRELLQSVELRDGERHIPPERFREQLQGWRFALGASKDGLDYGITVVAADGQAQAQDWLSESASAAAFSGEKMSSFDDSSSTTTGPPPRNKPSTASQKNLLEKSLLEKNLVEKNLVEKNLLKNLLGWVGRHPKVYDYTIQTVFLLILAALLGVILRYDTVVATVEDSAFEAFMDSQNFGVRFVFTGVGVIITFFWDYLFARTSAMNLYQKMSRRPQRAASSILASPTTTVFGSLGRAVADGDVLAGAVAAATVLSRFTPILLSNIPFKPTQTWQTHYVCAWATVAVLAFMLAVLLAALAARVCRPGPPLPAEPGCSVAEALYYVCDSRLLRDCEGLARLGVADRNRRVVQMGRRYRFGTMVGVSGRTRIGVDYADARSSRYADARSSRLVL